MALPKFCEKCETMHSAGRPCDARGLKAVSSRKPVPVAQPVEHPTFNGPTKLFYQGVEIIPDTIPAPSMQELLFKETSTAPGLKISSAAEAVIEEHLSDICRGIPGRGVAAPASLPVTAGKTNRDDEVVARQGEILHSSIESSRPPQPIPASSKGRIPFFENGDLGSSPGAGASSELPRQQPFDRIAYQRDYMRDRPLALAEGLTVKAWRVKHGKE